METSPYQRNKHPEDQIKRLAKIMKKEGVTHPISITKGTNQICFGEGRKEAAILNKWTEFPIKYVEFDNEDQHFRMVQSDNAVAMWAELDFKSINLDLQNFGPFDIDLLGIKDFVVEPADKYGDQDADNVPEVRTTSIKLGDLFQLGNHRLLCGDSTDRAQVERLLNGEKADMVFTDPPYGIGYEYNSHDDSSAEENSQMVAAALLAYECGKVWTPGKMNLERDMNRFGKAKIAIWYKKFAMAGSGLGGASTFEPILIVEPKEKHLPNDVLVVPTEREELNGQSLRELHSCPKPVDLYVQLIQAFTLVGDKIAEPFCGSGTTLIACEKTNRKCFGMEIDPQYCQVIIDRFEKFSNTKAVKIN